MRELLTLRRLTLLTLLLGLLAACTSGTEGEGPLQVRDVEIGEPALGDSNIFRAWVTNRAEGTVSVFVFERGALVEEPVAKLDCPGFPIRVMFTPDGSKALVSCAVAGEVEVFETANKVSLGRVAMPSPGEDAPEGGPAPIGMAVSADGTRAYVSLSAVDHVAELDLSGLQVLRTFPVGDEPDGIAWYRKPRAR